MTIWCDGTREKAKQNTTKTMAIITLGHRGREDDDWTHAERKLTSCFYSWWCTDVFRKRMMKSAKSWRLSKGEFTVNPLFPFTTFLRFKMWKFIVRVKRRQRRLKNRRLQQTIQKKVEVALFCTEHSTQHSLPLQNCYSLFQTTLLLKFTVCLEL